MLNTVLLTACFLLLVAILAILIVRLKHPGWPSGVHPASVLRAVAPELMPPDGEVTIVRKDGDRWVAIGRRPSHHPDLQEAYDTPGLAYIGPTGAVTMGKQ